MAQLLIIPFDDSLKESSSMQLNNVNSAIQVAADAGTKLSLQRSIDGVNFVLVEDFEMIVGDDCFAEFGISGYAPGQYVRLKYTGSINSIKALL